MIHACNHDDLDLLREGLLAAANQGFVNHEYLADFVGRAVRHNSISVVRYLVEHEGAYVDGVSGWSVSVETSIEMLELLLSHGWNINNQQGQASDVFGTHILQCLCQDEDFVRWGLEQGADPGIIDYDADPQHAYNYPSVLELVARSSSVAIFKLLLEHGARLEGRILHQAALGAKSDTGERIDMLKYLVDEVGLDVNAMDWPSDCAINLERWGTLICYAAATKEGHEEAVRFLLARGADPTITPGITPNNIPSDEFEDHDAFWCARFRKNEGISKILEEWRDKHTLEQ